MHVEVTSVEETVYSSTFVCLAVSVQDYSKTVDEFAPIFWKIETTNSRWDFWGDLQRRCILSLFITKISICSLSGDLVGETMVADTTSKF